MTLLELKIRLYHALLSMDGKDLSYSEIRIGFELSQDKDIQKELKRHKQCLKKG